ncbi:cell adhesion molecule DSCAML1 isoform X1 [Hydra vulgaris]|nr:Down syndrome cell adhesion molecule-like protein 1 homolog [Hydra vulgaris]XP_012558400.1 Down syndrome cell adhesion molecule-like protein 1 homolog [Hydra vulgaris]XP_012558401.1 Down syndrome cell adhesion molecule-like protein 1 homolog [Hydra vulgaris]XP_012558402.1 Down syndrome cell adhesion molecule-like protein 1 homolog [Hydra vulgaris]
MISIFCLLVCAIKVVMVNSVVEHQISFVSLKAEPKSILFLNTLTASLYCDAIGYPTPEIEWLTESGSLVRPIKGLISILNNELQFHAFKEENFNPTVHNAKYRCKVSNKVGALISDLAEVKVVIDKPYSPVIHHQIGLIGSIVIFKCQVPDSVSLFVKVSEWLIKHPRKDKVDKISRGRAQNQFHVLNTGDLIVSGIVKEYEDLEFSCVTQNVFNNATMTNVPGRLYVDSDDKFLEPSNFVRPVSQLVEYGQSFILNCQADGLFEYIWYKDGNYLDTINHILIGGSIFIKSARYSDAGVYKCLIKKEKYLVEFSAEIAIRVPLKITKAPANVLIKSGEVGTFSCSVDGSAPIQWLWLKDGHILQSSSLVSIKDDTLTIFDANIDDEGVYQCMASNKYETVQSAARLVIDGSLPKIESISGDGVFEQGSLLELHCSVSGQPLPTISWFLDNEKLDEKLANITTRVDKASKVVSFLTVYNSKSKDSGLWSCIAENKVGYVKAFSTISVKGFPTIINFKTHVYGVSKRPIFIDCRGKGYPAIFYKWYREGVQIVDSSNVKIFLNGTLFIKRFSENNVGLYWCEVTNIYGSYKATLNVIFLDPPQALPFTLHSVLIGDRSEFFCSLTRGSAVGLNYSWYKDGVKISEGNQRTWLIQKVKESDRGRYTCVVENNDGKDSYSNDFTVFEEPSFTKSPNDVSILEGKPVTQPCLVKGFPQPQVTWFRKLNGKLLRLNLNNRVRQLQNGSLYIRETYALDNGTYVCQASFFDHNIVPDPLMKEILLEVRVPPRIVATSPLEIREGKMQSVKIYCSSIGSLGLSVKWFKNNAIIPNENSKHVISTTLSYESTPPSLNSTLLITVLSQDDNGKYECNFINPFGSVKKEFLLFVEEEPHSPENLIQISSTSRSIHLSWRPGFNGNSPIISFRLEMKLWAANWNLGKFFITKETQYLVEGLSPGLKYSFRVSSSNRHGISEKSEEVSFTTKEEAPSAPPNNVTIFNKTEDKLLVTWLEPEKEYQNGIISGYRIGYVPSVHRSVPKQFIDVGAVNSALLQGLLQFTLYQVSVQAITSGGVGPSSADVFASTLEGVPSLAPPSVKAQAVGSQTLLVSWKTVPEDAVNGILCGYKVIYIDVERSEKREKSVLNSQQIVLNGLRKFTDYQINVLAYTNAGDGVPSQSIFQKTNEDIPEAPSLFSATPASPTEIGVTWSEPINRNGIITDYVLYYQEVGQYLTHRIELKSTQQSYKLQDLKFGQKYIIWMSAKTSKGEGQTTKRITTTPKDQVPSKIITPSRLTSTAKMGSDVTLPCAAVGHPKPIITWYKSSQSYSSRKQKRFMVADVPYTLHNVQEEDEGSYNCTAENKYGIDWNIVTLIVQTHPKPPHDINAYLVLYNALNFTWVLSFDGNSAITGQHVRYVESSKASSWTKVKLNSMQTWFVVYNITSSTIYFEVASENEVGIGQYSETIKIVISENGVIKSFERIVFVAEAMQLKKVSIKKYVQPTLIVLLIVTCILIILLLIASWDKDQKRLRKPAAYRLLCSFKRDRNFNSDPYGEPALPWPWNIRKVQTTEYDFIDTFGMPDEYLPNFLASGTDLIIKEPIKKSSKMSKLSKVSSCNSFVFEPAVHYSVNYIDEDKKYSADGSFKRYNDNTHRLTEKEDNPDDEFSAMEKLMQSPPFEPPSNKYSSSRTNFSPDVSLITLNSPFYFQNRGDADGKSCKDSTLLKESTIKNYTTLSGSSQISLNSVFKSNSSKPKSSDTLKTLESIEEKKVLCKLNNRAEILTSPKVALAIKEYLEYTDYSYESISSSCSSSVSELKRAYDFGKKYGVQDSSETVLNTKQDTYDNKEKNFHELFETLLFSGTPRDLNDTRVKIPIPIRIDYMYDVNKIDLGGTLREQSLV